MKTRHTIQGTVSRSWVRVISEDFWNFLVFQFSFPLFPVKENNKKLH